MNGPRVAIVLQARLGSMRLPGKVLSPISGQTILAHCIRRLRVSNIGPVIVATTTKPEDDLVAAEARRMGGGVMRGPCDDVLKRFAMVAEALGVDIVVRATADNPAVDMNATARVVTALETQKADYVVERDLPIGGAVEGVRVAALMRADKHATDPYDREHVTPYIRRHTEMFRVCYPAAPSALERPDLRFTVDTREDLRYMRGLFEMAGGQIKEPTISELMLAADVCRAGMTA